MICDPGERYLHSYYSDDWIAQQGLDLDPYLEQLQTFQQTGTMAALRT
jgi:cysteine synthase A